MISEGEASGADHGLLSPTDSPTQARDIVLASKRQQYERQTLEVVREALGKSSKPED